MAAGLFDQAVNHAEPQAAAFAGFLGGKKGFEGMFQHLGRHAATVIANRQHDIWTGSHVLLGRGVILVELNVAGFQRELATSRHGVAGIDGQIEQGAFELIRVDQGLFQVGGQHRIDLDIGAQGAPHEIEHAEYQLVQVGRLRQQRLTARERQ